MNLSKKPGEPHRKTLSPSSFYNIRCPRCLWLEYWHGIKMPVNMLLQQHLSRLQESAYDGEQASRITDLIPNGTVNKYKNRFTSLPLKVNGEETRWKIYGEIDLLVDHHDGTYSIIDGKVSLKKDADEIVESYWTQQEAYVYSFENPLDGNPRPIKTIGLIQWRIDDTYLTDLDGRGFTVEHRYIPIPRRPNEFQQFMEKFIGIIEGEFPESGLDCSNCKFFNSIGYEF